MKIRHHWHYDGDKVHIACDFCGTKTTVHNSGTMPGDCIPVRDSWTWDEVVARDRELGHATRMLAAYAIMHAGSDWGGLYYRRLAQKADAIMDGRLMPVDA